MQLSGSGHNRLPFSKIITKITANVIGTTATDTMRQNELSDGLSKRSNESGKMYK